MKLLFDAHSFIWWDFQQENLSPAARSALHDQSNTLILSIATVWEIQIKVGIGKLQLPRTLAELIRDQQEQNGITLLTIGLPHVLALEALPSHHKDPFDRLLIAQAKVENGTLVTIDPLIHQYDVPVLW
jgi:PIN domain nuclease of toxin-antitoxin system